jgi:hypothetical protein
MNENNEIVFHPVFKRPNGKIGIGFGCDSKQDAIENLIYRNKNLNEPDIRQWIKITRVKYEEISGKKYE